jgi:type I restriction enzyme S subunit
MEATKDFHLLKLVEEGDFVISLRSFQGGIELAHQRGIISPAYTILKERTPINKRYFKHLFKSKPFISLMTLCVKGIRDGQNIDYPTFKNEYLPFPPIEEQEKIGAYLDRKTQQIQEFIQKKERLIELLEDRRKAEIHKLITHGINKDVELINTGISWFDKIPKHWELKKLKHFADHVQRGSSPDYVNDIGIPVISQAVFSAGFIDKAKFKFQKNQNIESFKGRLFYNDVLVASTGGGVLGKSFLFEIDGNYIADGHVTIIRDTKKRFVPAFLNYILSINFSLIEGYLGQGSTNQTELQREWFRNMLFPFPSLEEQEEIVDTIKKINNEVDKAISKAQTEIEKAREYQESLITQVVTGQLKVPEKNYSIIKNNKVMNMVAEPSNTYQS